MRRLLLLVTLAAGCTIGPLATDRGVLVRNVAGRPYLSARYRSLCQAAVAGPQAECKALELAVNKLVDDDVLGETVRVLGPMLPEQKAELKKDLEAARAALRAVQAKAGTK